MDKNPGNVDFGPAGDEFILSGRVTVRKACVEIRESGNSCDLENLEF